MRYNEFPQSLRDLAEMYRYHLEHRPARRVRGWPTVSRKPYLLYSKTTGKFLAAFATPQLMERNLRRRVGR